MNAIRHALAPIALALLVPAAYAQDDAPPPKPDRPAREGPRDPMARLLDANGDRILSADEIKAAPAVLLTKDTDQNGALSQEELRLGGPGAGGEGEEGRPGGGMLARLDADGDGKISRDEAPDRLKERFDEIDSNADGFLDQEEIQAMRERFRGMGRREGRGNRGDEPGKPTEPTQPPQPSQPGGAGDARGGEGGPGGLGGGNRMRGFRPVPSLMMALDVNKDRSLSAEEIENAPKSLLTLDKDGDGALSSEEMMPPPRRPADELKDLDADKDGKISRTEAPEWMKGRFDRIDTNADGFLDEAELAALDAPRPRDRKPREDADAPK